MTEQVAASRWLNDLEREAARRDAYEHPANWWRFRVATSCPPSATIHVQGGLAYTSAMTAGEDIEHLAWDIPDLDIDLADTDQQIAEISFDAADHYKGYVLFLRTPTTLRNPPASAWQTWLIGSGDEFETYLEAEEDLLVFWEREGYDDFWDGAIGVMILCGFILRNDGRTGTAGAILPVDRVNRGRSYLWPTDLRERTPAEG